MPHKYKVTAQGGTAGSTATATDSAKEALYAAEKLREHPSLTNIKITTADGRSYDLDEFRRIVGSVDVRSV
jgi:hypothetical protein